MKKLFTTLAASAVLAVGFSVPTVSADSANWSPEKAAQIAINRCANAGLGNKKERIENGECLTGLLAGGRPNPENPDGQRFPDIDPGNSGKNANNRK